MKLKISMHGNRWYLSNDESGRFEGYFACHGTWPLCTLSERVRNSVRKYKLKMTIADKLENEFSS